MIVEVQGVGFQNKGAELMLRAIVERARGWDDVSLAVPAFLDFKAERTQLGLCQKLSIPHIDRHSELIASLVPLKIRHRLKIVTESEIQAVLDASGFLYGDQWGTREIGHRARQIDGWKRQGKVVILLPQAFGPFQNPSVRNLMIEVLEKVDLVFARDRQSHEYLQMLDVSPDLIKIAPDLTINIAGRVPESFVARSRWVAIVPNQRMVDKTSTVAARNYVLIVQKAIEWLLLREFEPFFVIHDHAGADQGLIDCLQERLPKPIQVLMEPDPVLLKGILGTSYITIGSRYHSLVGALSQGIPTLGMGWSHKYHTLFEDFDCAHCLLDIASFNEDLLESKMMLLTGELSRSIIIQSLESANQVLSKRIDCMWEEVEKYLALEN